VLQFDLSVTWR